MSSSMIRYIFASLLIASTYASLDIFQWQSDPVVNVITSFCQNPTGEQKPIMFKSATDEQIKKVCDNFANKQLTKGELFMSVIQFIATQPAEVQQSYAVLHAEVSAAIKGVYSAVLSSPSVNPMVKQVIGRFMSIAFNTMISPAEEYSQMMAVLSAQQQSVITEVNTLADDLKTNNAKEFEYLKAKMYDNGKSN